MSNAFATRQGTASDENFVFATWLRCYRHSSAFARRIQDGVFFKFHQAAVARILGRGAVVTVCTPSGEPDLILGYSVAEGSTLHFVYVKKPFRRQGIAKTLLEPAPVLFTHWTNDWDALMGKVCPQAQYNPYLI